MTVKELIETNACIVEAYITLRGDYQQSLVNGKREFKDSEFVHEFAIGQYASMGKDAHSLYERFGRGERGSKFKAPYTIINKELNTRASQKYWNVKTNVIPKDVLELEVGQWSTSSSAYNWLRMQSQRVGYESAQEIRITVYLPPERVTEIRIDTEVKAASQLTGQMTFSDIPGVMP